MVITVPAQTQPPDGPRPINLNRDIPQVLRLLELVFGRSMGAAGHQLMGGGFERDRQPAFLWRFAPGAGRLAMGYVWEEKGRIIANATMLSTKTTGRYLVVNVAVHPDYRRRGIARELMETVLSLVVQRQGHEVLLQVEKDNTPAVGLYRALGFDTIGSITTWRAPVSVLREISARVGDEPIPYVRQLGRGEWQAAYELDLSSLHPDLNWPDSLPPDSYRGGFRRWIDGIFNTRRSETWVVAGPEHKLLGLAGIRSEWGRPHRANIRVHPDYQGRLERPLLAKIVRRLRYFPRRNVRFDHRDDDSVMSELLREANFRPRRTLTHMRLTL